MHTLKHTLKKGGFWFSMGFVCLFISIITGLAEYKFLSTAFFYGAFICLFFMYYWSAKHVIKGNKVVFRFLRKKLRNKKEGRDESE